MSNIITWKNSNITRYYLGLDNIINKDDLLRSTTTGAANSLSLSIKNVSPYAFELSYSQPGGTSLGACVPMPCLSNIDSGAEQSITLGSYDSSMILGYNIQNANGQNIGGFSLFISQYSITLNTIYGKECEVGSKKTSSVNEISCGEQPHDRDGIYNVPQEYSSGAKYRGINLTGAEWGGNVNQLNWPDIKLAQYYVDKGMNTIRFPIRWDYIQPELYETIDFTSPGYAQRVDNIYTDFDKCWHICDFRCA